MDEGSIAYFKEDEDHYGKGIMPNDGFYTHTAFRKLLYVRANEKNNNEAAWKQNFNCALCIAKICHNKHHNQAATQLNQHKHSDWGG